jgi:type VI secretion system protein ImpB
MEKKELPLVIGVLADLSGHPEATRPKLKQRGFVDIDKDNFNDVLASIAPRLSMQVRNRIKDEGLLNTELRFRSMEDFTPVNLLMQIPQLRRLFEARMRLSDLLTKLDGNDQLEGLLRRTVASPESLNRIQSERQADQVETITGNA